MLAHPAVSVAPGVLIGAPHAEDCAAEAPRLSEVLDRYLRSAGSVSYPFFALAAEMVRPYRLPW